MTHPYVIIRKQDWLFFISQIKDGIAYLLALDGATDDQIKQQLSIYVKELGGNREHAILEIVALEMAAYCSFYKVKPTDGIYDEFKGIYFIGMCVAKTLDSLGYPELNKLALKSMLGMLNHRLNIPYNADRDALTTRVLKIIDEDKLDEHFGRFGLYLIFKCLFNAAKEYALSLNPCDCY